MRRPRKYWIANNSQNAAAKPTRTNPSPELSRISTGGGVANGLKMYARPNAPRSTTALLSDCAKTVGDAGPSRESRKDTRAEVLVAKLQSPEAGSNICPPTTNDARAPLTGPAWTAAAKTFPSVRRIGAEAPATVDPVAVQARFCSSYRNASVTDPCWSLEKEPPVTSARPSRKRTPVAPHLGSGSGAVTVQLLVEGSNASALFMGTPKPSCWFAKSHPPAASAIPCGNASRAVEPCAKCMGPTRLHELDWGSKVSALVPNPKKLVVPSGS